MNDKELIDFANWLWDMGYLNINSQLPPFKNAETLANHYSKVKKLNIPDVVGRSEQLCPMCKSDDLLDIDDHYTHCQKCGFQFVGA